MQNYNTIQNTNRQSRFYLLCDCPIYDRLLQVRFTNIFKMIILTICLILNSTLIILSFVQLYEPNNDQTKHQNFIEKLIVGLSISESVILLIEVAVRIYITCNNIYSSDHTLYHWFRILFHVLYLVYSWIFLSNLSIFIYLCAANSGQCIVLNNMYVQLINTMHIVVGCVITMIVSVVYLYICCYAPNHNLNNNNHQQHQEALLDNIEIQSMLSDQTPYEISECIVCFDPIYKDNVFYLHCGHGFHPECIYRWVYGPPNMHTTCPICKKDCIKAR